MKKRGITILCKIIRGILCTIGLIWIIIQLSWFEIRDYRIFYLPKMDSYVCVRFVKSGYKGIDKYIDISFGDTIESVKESNPWDSDIIRIPARREIRDYWGVRTGDNGTIYFVNLDQCQFIQGKGDKEFVYQTPLDEPRLVSRIDLAASDFFTYSITTTQWLKIKNIKIYSLNEDEEIKEIF